MSAPAARLAGPRARLQAWVGESLLHRLASLTVVLALAVLLPAAALSLFLSWRLVEHQLDARLRGEAELHGSRMAMALEATREVLADVAASPLLGTALVDARAWQQYGAPFLRSLRIPVPVPARLALCDFRGRVLASSGEAPSLEPLDWVAAVVDGGEWRAVVHGGGGGGGDHLLILAPVRYAGSGTVEGAVAAELPLAELGEHAFQGAAAARLVGVDGRVLAGDRSSWSGRRWLELPVAAPEALSGLGLRVQVASAPGQLAASVAGLLLVHLAVGALILALALAMAHRLATQLARPLMALAGSVEAISAGGDLSNRAPVDGRDEVARLATSFNAMLARLEAAQAATERALRSEKAEAEESARLAHAALERSTEAISIDEAGGRIAWVNEAACRLLGRPRELVIGRHTWEVDPTLTRERWDQLFGVVRAAGRFTAERAMPNAGGPPRWIEANVYPVRLGERDYCVSVMRDVTSRREAEAALRLAGVGTLAAGAAHEINNPLTSVMGNLSFLRETLREVADLAPVARQRALDEAGEAVQEAHQAAERVRDVVRGLKAFARPDVEAQESTDLVEVARGAVALARHEVRHKGRLVEQYGPVPPVLASRRRLEQVVLNLLLNAAHAIPEAGDAGEVAVVVGTAAGGEALVEVRDNGAGMAPEVRARVFEPFFTTKAVGAGTGLGLAICHGIVAASGGRIEVESEPGRGSVFRVLLPAMAAHALGVSARPGGPAPAPAPPAAGLLPGLRILVVDDDRPVLRAVTRALGPGPEVVAISDPHEALRRLLAGERFDVVLCDLMMPGLSGMDLYAALREARPQVARRVVFITGGAFTQRAREFLASVQNPCLDKPFEPEDLRRMVQDRLASLVAPT